MAVRYRVLARRSANLDWPGGKRNNHFRDLAKGSGTSGRDVENPLTAIVQHRASQRGHVVDMHVIALLLALPEQRDRLTLGRKPPEAVWAVAVVGIFCPIDQRRPQDRERQLERSTQHDLAREMHDAV